ncbi:unnamed protein product [Owenia fusiformis]|uniref:CAP-Gly domain-containing protein n=1 Tax=Owenia fusiformis TaxID=6347 RepID=A0A8S4N3G5_OWEFU|nr:unnamed protein product [Owenia fusiformis]
MTFGEANESTNNAIMMDTTTYKQREKAKIHSAVDAPMCDTCRGLDFAFFDPGCQGCHDLLTDPGTSIAEIFAVIRQWTPQTQQNIDLFTSEILKRGANVNDRDSLTDMTLLHYACKSGAHGIGDVTKACEIVEMLISIGADVFTRCRWTNMSPLHYAVFFDVTDIVKILLKTTKCLDIDSRCSDVDHGTSLHISASNLAFDTMKCLLQNGADPSIRDDLGRTAFECIPEPGLFESNSDMNKLVFKMRKALSEAESQCSSSNNDYVANYDNVPGKVTLQSLGVHIGERIMVGGVKCGILKFCGPTEFAPGMWAGIELDEPEGKNDGTVNEISYFKCPPKHGIFAPVSKICKPGQSPRRRSSVNLTPNKGKIDVSHVTKRVDTGLGTPRSGRTTPVRRQSSSTISHGTPDVSKVGAKVDTGLRSRSHTPSGEQNLEVGDRVVVAGQRKGTIRYAGETKFAPGLWFGIELDRSVGKNDGAVNGERYFKCRPKHGVFAPPSRVQRFFGSMRSLAGSRDSLDSVGLGTTPRSLSGSQSNISSTPRSKTPVSSRQTSSARKSLSSSFDFKLTCGMSVFCNNELGVVRYIGPTDFAEGTWLGVELRTPKGKNDGSVNDRQYFTCKPDHGLLVRPSKVTVRGINGAKLLGERD